MEKQKKTTTKKKTVAKEEKVLAKKEKVASNKNKVEKDVKKVEKKKDKKKETKKVKKESFFKGVKSEMSKVVWPSKKNMIKYSIATVVFVIFFALYFYGIEVLMAWLKANLVWI